MGKLRNEIVIYTNR